jgi:MoaA/NifB/PqqE/SkfB family radical SAM enzyme
VKGKQPVDTAWRIIETDALEKIHFLWLEITGKCQRECEHCYAESGPKGSHGTMSEADWKRVIEEGAEAGVKTVQFIGGEPTLHPALPELIRYALSQGLEVEVFSNMEHIKPHLWDALSQEGVSMATSYYSANNQEHDSIVRRRGSYARTKANIAEALRRDIPLRVGVIGLREEQNVERAIQDLGQLGVDEPQIGVDYLRQVGRGIRNQSPSTDQLCGHCANGVLAILPDGGVQPCVFSRWPQMTVGNVHEQSLRSIVEGEQLAKTRTQLREAFAQRRDENALEVVGTSNIVGPCLPGVCDPLKGPCVPDMCHPTLYPPCDPQKPPCPPECRPNCWPSCQPNCGPACSPSCYPQGNCRPVVG